jgi:hypothetical protein
MHDLMHHYSEIVNESAQKLIDQGEHAGVIRKCKALDSTFDKGMLQP